MAQRVARDAMAVRAWQLEWFAEEPGRQLFAKRRELQPLAAFRFTDRGEFAVGVVALAALVGGVEQGPVGPFEIEQHAQRFAHALVGECRTAVVHEQRLGVAGNPVRYLGPDDLAARQRRELVAIGPVLGLMLDEEIELADLERFERHRVVAIELHVDAVEVVLAAIDCQVFAPPILYPLENQLASGQHLDQAIRSAAERRIEGSCLEIATFPVVLRQYR
ncbi:hypothetical protein D3C77_343260 [compost metagenome]